jgi:hypothetical protein
MTNFGSCGLRRISRCAALGALLAGPVLAANLQGRVIYRAAGMTHPAAVASALVTAYHTNSGRQAVTRTNDLGVYRLQNLPAGLYVILVEKDGRRLFQGKLEVREPGRDFDISL